MFLSPVRPYCPQVSARLCAGVGGKVGTHPDSNPVFPQPSARAHVRHVLLAARRRLLVPHGHAQVNQVVALGWVLPLEVDLWRF